MGKRNKYATPAVPEARVLELVGALESDSLGEPLSDAEVTALADHLGAAQRVDVLVALREQALSKDQRKAVNKALYALEQRGIEVPPHKDRPAPVSFALDPVDHSDLPVLTGPPLSEATRFVLLPYVSDRTLYHLRIGFAEPVGLQTLDGSIVARGALQRVARSVLTAKHTTDDPGFVDAGQAFGARKLWEVGTLFRAGRFGTEIDHELREVLVFPRQAPPHPADELDLSGVEPASVAELYEHPAAVAALLSTSLRVAVQEGYAAAPGSVYDDAAESILRAEAVERRCAQAFVEGWGLESAREVFKDAALYWSLADEPQFAALYLEIAREPDDAVMRTRLERLMMSLLASIRRLDAEARKAMAGASTPEE